MIDERILKSEERAVFLLRALFRRFGYSQYKMSKFEEYDLYGRNKAFLVSDGIITFTDSRGRLMALKPDVTLSIVKNSKDLPGSVQKTCYNESVYRRSGSTGEFREIMQTGLECIGDVSLYHICEVLDLAVKSLQYIDGDYILDLSHAGLVSALLERRGLEEETLGRVLDCVRAKNPAGAAAIPGVDGGTAELARLLTADYGDVEAAWAALEDYLDYSPALAAMEEFSRVYSALRELGLTDRMNIDFSISNDMDYYSGVVFKGYIRGIPTGVLSGGQYDKLMQRMGRSSGAIGFAVYLDVLERIDRRPGGTDTELVLLRSPEDDPAALIRAVESLSAGGESVAVLSALPPGYRCRRVYRLQGKELIQTDGDR